MTTADETVSLSAAGASPSPQSPGEAGCAAAGATIRTVSSFTAIGREAAFTWTADAFVNSKGETVSETDAGRRYVQAFGAIGALWCVEGVAFDDAHALHAKLKRLEDVRAKHERGEVDGSVLRIAQLDYERFYTAAVRHGGDDD